MKQNIKINHTRHLDAKLYNANYYDFMLFKGETNQQNVLDLENMCLADFSKLNIINGVLYSDVLWTGATNSGVELTDIGFTGMDNGFISFRKDRITNEKFLDLYLNSTLKIESGDTRLFLTPITGNTQEYVYPMSLIEGDENFVSFKGGFYQGFFKLEGTDYQTLPTKLDKELFLHFDLRPRSDYNVETNTINYTHPNNDGIFFYLGTRAENKFWPFYKTNKETIKTMKKINAQTEGYFNGCNELSGTTYNINKNNVIMSENNWVLDEPEEIKEVDGYFEFADDYFAFDFKEDKLNVLKPKTNIIITTETNSYKPYFNISETSLNTYDFNPNGACVYNDKNDVNAPITPSEPSCNPCCENYFSDSYFDNKCPEIDNNKFVTDDFIGSGITIDAEGYETSEGHAHNERGFYEIKTDNKFLIFDRTPNGFTTKNWVEGTKIALTGKKNWPNANYFMLMNRTETGYTTNTIQQYNEEHQTEFNIYKDLRGNTFALRITKNGAIGYRYGVLDCNNENKFSIIEEYSKDNIIKYDKWNSVNVRFTEINASQNKCSNHKTKMKIMIYVNGYLVFISKDLDSFNFKALDEVYEKQEGVPYNISIGGGSLGLLETIIPNYYAISEYILPIEQNFCGSFLGDIKSFKIYDGFIDYSSITNYLS